MKLYHNKKEYTVEIINEDAEGLIGQIKELDNLFAFGDNMEELVDNLRELIDCIVVTDQNYNYTFLFDDEDDRNATQ